MMAAGAAGWSWLGQPTLQATQAVIGAAKPSSQPPWQAASQRPPRIASQAAVAASLAMDFCFWTLKSLKMSKKHNVF